MSLETAASSNEKIKTQWWVLSLGIVLMSAKFAAYYFSHSNAILSDALESIVNIVAGAFGLYSLYLSSKPRDEDHPYGHGKIEFVSATVEGALIIIAGLIIGYKAIMAFIHPQPLGQLGLGIILIAISGALNYLMGHYAVKQGEKSHSLALEASGEHLKSDAYSTIGILAGLFIIYLTGVVWLDNVIALIMGAIIIISGGKILKRSLAGIMDEADFDLNLKVVEHINENRREDWIDVHNFRVIKYGGIMHIDCHITMPWYYTLKQSHDGMKDFESCLQNSLTTPVESFIHIDPCVPTSCSICQVRACPHRQHPFVRKVDWTLENIIANKKHS